MNKKMSFAHARDYLVFGAKEAKKKEHIFFFFSVINSWLQIFKVNFLQFLSFRGKGLPKLFIRVHGSPEAKIKMAEFSETWALLYLQLDSLHAFFIEYIEWNIM